MSHWRVARWGMLGFALMLGAAAAGSEEPTAWPARADAEWDALFTRSDGWTGGDAMYSLPLDDQRVLWLFADTWIGPVQENRHAAGSRLVNNTIAVHPAVKAGRAPAREGLHFFWQTGADGEPQAWIRPEQTAEGCEDWFWVADGMVIPSASGASRLAICLWRITRNDDPGVFGFRSAGGDLALIENPHEAVGEWRVKQWINPHAVPPGDKNLAETSWGSELWVDPEDATRVVIAGVREQSKLEKQMVLARAPAAAIEDFSQWEFRTADGWSPKLSDAVAVVRGVSNEYSVTRVEREGKAQWVLIQSEPLFGAHILARHAQSPYGPWSAPQRIYRVPELAKHDKYFTYAAKAHPELSAEGELLITYVVNSFDFGAMVRDASIYRPRFVRVALADLLSPP
jgi:hypothetical protein